MNNKTLYATESIWNTPLLKLRRLSWKTKSNIFWKLEFFNPWWSVKDRLAKRLIEDAEERWIIKQWDTLIEPTSWNTGIWLAWIWAIKNYKVILVMPDNMSKERVLLMQNYWAEVILTPAAKGTKWSVEKAKELVDEKWYKMLDQFSNPANPQVHYETTGPEIWEAMDGKVDVFISASWTGGTITWAWKFLKEKNPNIHIVVVEPSDSPVLSGWKPWPHMLAGMWPWFIPKILDTQIYDEVITVKNEDAFSVRENIAKTEWIFVWISAGAAWYAALEIWNRFPWKNIVVILPDTGERYLSVEI